jgi:hypothetical protein
MYDALFMTSIYGRDHLFEQLPNFQFFKAFLLFHVLNEFSSISVFHDEQQLILDHEGLLELNDVLMIQHLKDLGFSIYILDGISAFRFKI